MEGTNNPNWCPARGGVNVCRRCGKTTPCEAMATHRASPHGHQLLCRACNRARCRKYRADNPDYMRQYNDARREEQRAYYAEWMARNRGYWADRDPWAEHPTGTKVCGACRLELPVERFWRHSINADGLQQKCRDCDSARGATREDKAAWRHLARTRPPCAYCGAPTSDHIDHVMPRSLGGTDTDDNYLPACSSCNLSKNARHPTEWLTERCYVANFGADDDRFPATNVDDPRVFVELIPGAVGGVAFIPKEMLN